MPSLGSPTAYSCPLLVGLTPTILVSGKKKQKNVIILYYERFVKMKSVMQSQYAQLPQAKMPRSVFNRSHGYKTTFDSGYLVPFFIDEIYPGDTVNLNTTLLARLATSLTPFMDNLYLDTFYFYVPFRLLWDNWKKMHGEQVNPDDTTDYVTPKLTSPASTGWLEESLEDYFGLPVGKENVTVNSLYHRGYNKIYNDWFRPQDLIDSVTENTGDGPDNNSDYTLLKRAKRHDYFTSCLPFPQKGDGVELPLGTQAPITGLGNISSADYYTRTNISVYESDNTTAQVYANASELDGTRFYIEEDPDNNNVPNLYADLSEAAGATINSLRQAFSLQKMYELDARGGTRYTEMILSHFGVTSPDARLQRPEYLGGSSTPIYMNVIQQTSESSTGKPLGDLAGNAIANEQNSGFVKSFTEHGMVIGLVNVRADLTYQQGLEKMFSRSSRTDYYLPVFANLGEQAVLNQEIYCQGTSDDENVFGYQERWAELRHKPSKITGKLRSTSATSLDCWHLSQEFTSLPTLSETFINENPPIDRVTAVADEPEFIMDSFIRYIHTRTMPVHSIPSGLDRF